MADPTFAEQADALWLLNIASRQVEESGFFDGVEKGRARRARKTVERAIAATQSAPEVRAGAVPVDPQQEGYASESSATRPEAVGRRVVCAALRASDGRVLLGIRHYSKDMHEQISRRDDRLRFQHLHDPDQGFVDQFGVYMTREEAYAVAAAAGQIVWPEGCGEGLDGPKLYSEGLY